MKKIIFIIVLCLSIFSNAQEIKVLDSTSLVFKAKLLTVDLTGIDNKESILNHLENKREHYFLKTKYSSFVFIKIVSKKPDVGWYRNKKGCSFYLAFNLLNTRFYRLGGFDIIDIDNFIKDLKEQEIILFKDLEGGNEIEEMDIYCLYEYYEMKPKKRLKKGFSCFQKCSKEIIDKIGNPH
ncbi:hypothetical protein [Aquimarina sp. Aq107]|uniref:hypothetical protein n=1 Tax=Aquimarina sp. Aq107 TaxID=1191912 RepID=UPI000D54D2A9|nr:hypothetical protein [Aquimarina sp. Aq107]